MALVHGPIELVLPASVGMVREPWTAEKVERAKPLLNSCPYLARTSFTEERPDDCLDLDEWRTRFRAGKSLAELQWEFHLGQMPKDFSPWLTADPIPTSPVVIHRSPRYHTRDFPWVELLASHREKITVVGSPDEHAALERIARRPLAYRPTPTLADLAGVIAGSSLFVGNESSPAAIAHGLGHRCWIEARSGNRPGAVYFKREGAYYGADDWPQLRRIFDNNNGLGKRRIGS